MAAKNSNLTGVEKFFEDNEIIVSKTDLKGRITYSNDIFQRVSGFSEAELLGQPHSIIRHPHMPRCVFKLLWDTLSGGQEIFAYVLNRCKNGDHYWVFAHVTPSFDNEGNIISFHSSRRVPDRRVVDDAIAPLYQALLQEEQSHSSAKEGMASSFQMVLKVLEDNKMEYDEFIFSLSGSDQKKAG